MNLPRRVRQAHPVAHAQLRVAPPAEAHGGARKARRRREHAPRQAVQPRCARLKQRIVGNRYGIERRPALDGAIDALLLRPDGQKPQGIHRPVGFAVPLQLQIGLRVDAPRTGSAAPQGTQRETAAPVDAHEAARGRRDVPQRAAQGAALPVRRGVNYAVPVGHLSAPRVARLCNRVPPERRQRRRVGERILEGRGEFAADAVHSLKPQHGLALHVPGALHLKRAQRAPLHFVAVHRSQLRQQRRAAEQLPAQQRAARSPLPRVVHQIQRAARGEHAAGGKRAVRALLHRERGDQCARQRNLLSALKNNASAHAQLADGRVHQLRPIHRSTSPSSTFPRPPTPARRPPCAERPRSGRRSCTPSPWARRSPGRDTPP